MLPHRYVVIAVISAVLVMAINFTQAFAQESELGETPGFVTILEQQRKALPAFHGTWLQTSHSGTGSASASINKLDIICLSAKQFMITEVDSVTSAPFRRMYCNNGPLYLETAADKTVQILPYRRALLDGLAVGIPALALDPEFEKRLPSFKFVKTDTAKGYTYSGSFKKLDTVTDAKEKEVLSKVTLAVTFQQPSRLIELSMNLANTLRSKKVYSDYKDFDGMDLPQSTVVEVFQSGGNSGKTLQLTMRVDLKNFQKLTGDVATQIPGSYPWQAGYTVYDRTSPSPVKTTSDELMKKDSAGSR